MRSTTLLEALCCLWLIAAAFPCCSERRHRPEGPRPSPEALVGCYVPTEKTKGLLAAKGGYPEAETCIVLKDDSTFIMKNMPDWWLLLGFSRHEFDSGVGTWRIRGGTEWLVELSFASTEGFNSKRFEDRSLGFRVDIVVAGAQRPYGLRVDPSEEGRGTRSMFFETSGTDCPCEAKRE